MHLFISFLRVTFSAISLVACLSLFFGNAQAQSRIATFKALKEKNGLSHNKVYAILHDSQGYMWFGTKEGLNRYDGYDITVFTHQPEDSTSLTSHHIQSLYEDSRGQLWIGTYDGGLNLYDRNTHTFRSFRHDPNVPNSLSADNIYTIYEDSRQHLWIGTYGGGLCRYNPKEQNFTVYKNDPNQQNSLSSNAVFDICEDKQGRLWLATFGGGLCVLDPTTQTFNTYLHIPGDTSSLPGNDLFALEEDARGNLWIGTYGAGLARYDPQHETFTSYRHTLPLRDPYLLDLERDPLGNLWFATRGGKVGYVDTRENKLYDFPLEATGKNAVAANKLCLDKSGLLWVATDGEGIYRTYMPSTAFNYYIGDGKAIPGFVAKSVTALCEDGQGTLWIGTFGDGVYRLDRQTGKVINYKNNFFEDNSLAGDFITALVEDARGNLWVGTSDNGLSRFDPQLGRWKTYRYEEDKKDGINSNAISSLYLDNRGTLWIGTYGGGLCRYDQIQDTFVHFADKVALAEKPLANSTVTTIYQDDLWLWIGTKESGLYRMGIASGRYTHYDQGNSGLPGNEITGLAKDAQGFLWIGTFDKGICRLDARTNRFDVLNDSLGLASNSVCGILSGKDSSLWISTVRGISRLQPKTFSFDNYTQDNGLFSHEFVQWSCYQNKKGELFFGGLDHFVSFDPSSVNTFDYQPPLYTVSFFLYDQLKTFSEPTSQVKKIELEHDDNFFEFEYALLSFLDPEKTQYAYIMEGVDKDWKYAENRRLASYTNLDAGRYTFRIKASDQPGVWHEVAQPLTIVIHPAWYHTWWFRISALLLVAGLSFTYYFLKITAIKKQKDRLEALVFKRTYELVEKNKEIQAQKDKIEEKNTDLLEAQYTIEERNYELKVINEELEYRVEQRTSELKKSNRRLKEANEELDMFVYRSYHDIIGPISRIEGLCKVAALDVKDELALQYVQMLDKSIYSAKHTLHKVLDIYNIRNHPLTPAPIDVRVLTEEMISTLLTQHPAWSSTPLSCRFQTDARVETDITLLKNILQSLIENAYQYRQTEQASAIQLTLSEGAGNTLVVCVEDNGIGILPALQPKIFTMFFRGTADRSGTGLGLYIAKVAAQKLSGDITYRQKDQHTVFELIMPRHLVQAEASTAMPDQQTHISLD